MTNDELTEAIIGAAIEVHRELGAGLLERAYQKALAIELRLRGMEVKEEVLRPIVYKGYEIDEGYRIDILVNDEVILELKSVEEIVPVHKAQVITYLRLSEKERGLLINFNVELLKDGITRLFRQGKDK